MVDRQKFALMSCLLAGFIAGGICGLAEYTTVQIRRRIPLPPHCIQDDGECDDGGNNYPVECSDESIYFAAKWTHPRGELSGARQERHGDAFGLRARQCHLEASQHGLYLKDYSSQGWDEHTVDRLKFALMSSLVAGFIAGGICG